MTVNDYFKNEVIHKTKWGYLVLGDMGMTQVHEVLEEIQDLERQLGTELMLLRDREGRIP